MSFDFNSVFEETLKQYQTDTVVILGHMNPDGDACGSVMGLAHYIHDVYPELRVFPFLSEKLDKGPKRMAMKDPVFSPFQAPDLQDLKEPFLVIICDTSTRARIIGREYYERAACSIVIDHHASNEEYGTRNFVEISESCAENVFHSLNWERWIETEKTDAGRKTEKNESAADYFYMGMIHDTHCFQRIGPETLSAAQQLLFTLGADHKKILATMYDQTLEDMRKQSFLLNKAESTMEGKVAWIFLTREESEKHGIEYEHIHPMSGTIRDCEDVQLGFTMFEEAENLWRCSFRSDGKWINVDQLLRPFGGGGHAGAAGLRVETKDPEGLRDRILSAVSSLKSSDRRNCF